MQSNLAAMQDIAMQNHRENEILGRIAKQTQKDSTDFDCNYLFASHIYCGMNSRDVLFQRLGWLTGVIDHL
jgi:hypothetical protein